MIDENNNKYSEKIRNIRLKPNLQLQSCFQLKRQIIISCLLLMSLFICERVFALDIDELKINSTYEFKKMPKFIIPRTSLATATELQDGRILFAGGMGEQGNITEVYNPTSNKFTQTANMNISRTSNAAILLKNGDVLFTGGIKYEENKPSLKLKSAEIYSVRKNEFIQISDMNSDKTGHKMFELKNGNILVIQNPNNMEIFDISTYTFKKQYGLNIENINEDKIAQYYNFLQVDDNKILMIPIYKGAKYKPLILNLNDFSFISIDVDLKPAAFYAVSKINSNKILITGGGISPGIRTVEILDIENKNRKML